jgi:hypothetical protein
MNKPFLTTVSAIAAAVILANSAVFAAPPVQTDPPPIAQTHTNKRQRPNRLGTVLVGRVVAVDGAVVALDVRPRRGDDVRITTTPSTTLYVPGVASPALTNLKSGDRVSVLLDKMNRETPTALAISVIPAPDSVIVGGEASNRNGSTFTLTPRRGDGGTVDASNATIIVPGQTNATLAAIQDGDRVIVRGEPTGSQSVTANLVVVVPNTRDNIAGGVIASISGNTLVVFTPAGQQLKVDVSKAVIVEPRNETATLTDLQVGKPSVIIGFKNADGSMTAQLVAHMRLPNRGL